MTSWSFSRLSIARKVPALIFGLLLLVITALSSMAYLTVRRSAQRSAITALESAVKQITEVINDAAQKPLGQARTMAADPALRDFLRLHDARTRTLALAALQYRGPRPEEVLAVELWSVAGKRELAEGPSASQIESISGSELRRDKKVVPASIGRLRLLDKSVIFPVAAAVAGGDDPVGYVVHWHRLSLTVRLTDSEFFLGNSDGSLWTGLKGVVGSPPIDLKGRSGVLQYDRPGGGTYLAAAAPVTGTPWLGLVEMPRAAVVAPANRFLSGIAVMALVLFAIGLTIAWRLSHRITKPIAQLTEATASIAAGDYSGRVQIDRDDELGLLGSTFNRMAAKTQDLLGQLEAKVLELEESQAQNAQSQARLLHWSEERLARVLETAHEAFVGMDSEGRIVDWNPRAETTFGWSREEILGRNLSEMIIPERYREAHHRGLSRFLETGDGPVLNRRFEITALHRDGHEFPIELAIWPLRWKNGHLFHALLHDITDRKKAEEELRKSEESLRRTSAELEVQSQRAMEANRQKSEFLANMSHELRTPLNAIIGFSELIYDGRVGPISADQKEYLGDVLASSRHLLQLINDVLDLAKVESGKIEFRPEPADLGRIAEEVRDGLRTIAAQKQIRVDVSVDPSLADVFTDPSRLKQVLYNYVSNAIKFSHGGGLVSIRVQPEGETEFRIEVEDFGIGIEPEHIDRLFVEFQQLDPGTNKRYSGTGLGLALTKRIVEAQKGRVGVRSTPGKGSTFFAVLPRVATAEPDIDVTAALPRAERLF